jgi:hypothetical protein
MAELHCLQEDGLLHPVPDMFCLQYLKLTNPKNFGIRDPGGRLAANNQPTASTADISPDISRAVGSLSSSYNSVGTVSIANVFAGVFLRLTN